jgi:DNA-directed RNA polymerase subunit L
MNRFRTKLHSALFSFEDAKSTYEAPEKENPDTRINTENEWNNKERLNKKIRGLVNCIRDVKFENRDDKISFKKYDKD